MKPPSPPFAPQRPNATEGALQAAAFAIQSNRPAEAERIAGEVMRRSRGDARANQLYGYALLMQGKARDAIAPLQRAFKQTRDTAIETQLAVALQSAGQIEEAMERFQHAVSRTPPFAPAFLEYGMFLYALDRRDEAIGILRRGAELAPDYADLSLRLGHALSARGDLAGTREVLARAHAASPKHPDVLYSLARTLQAEQKFEDAADAYRRVLAVTPQDAAAKIGLGICLTELGGADEALDHLRAASRSSEKKFGEVVTALVDAGRGRFWLRPSDAMRALKENGS